MVPLSRLELTAKVDQIVRSVDLAVRDLLADGADPFALANYLWTVRRHNLVLVNGDRLCAWGAAWAQRVLVEGLVGRKADEEIAAASLAAVALSGAGVLPIDTVVADKLQLRLSQELETCVIPFGSPPYGAALLLAAREFGLSDSLISRSILDITDAYGTAIPRGRLVGIGLAASLLHASDDVQRILALQHRLRVTILDPEIGYEDQVYAAQAILELNNEPYLLDSAVVDIEQVVLQSPAWSYLMVGIEDIEPAGDRGTVVYVSHLYRSALLDVILRIQRDAASREEARWDRRLRGRKATGGFAFLGIVCAMGVPWLALTWTLAPSLDEGRRYWLGSDYDAMTPSTALPFLLGSLATLYLTLWTPAMIVTLYKLLVRSAVESDHRVATITKQRNKRALAIWAVLVPVVVGIVNEPLVHALRQL